MKIMHNFLRLFKKDKGAHFTYNLGVGLMRLSAVLVLLAAVLACYVAFQPDNTLELYDTVEVTVTSTDIQKYKRGHSDPNGNIHDTAYYTYTVTFSGTYSNGSGFTLTQYVTQPSYNTYTSVQGKHPVEMNLYRSDLNNDYFISSKGMKEAAKEYREINPSLGSRITYAAVFYVLIGAAVLAVIACGEMKVSLKYPRTDVPLTQTELAAKKETDDLMKEFDEAYEQFMARKKAGLPTESAAAARLPDKSGSRKRIE